MVAGGTQQRFAVVIEQQAVNPDARDHSHLVEREKKASKRGNWNVDVYELLREVRSRSVRERCRERIELKDPVHGEESERERCSLTRHSAALGRRLSDRVCADCSQPIEKLRVFDVELPQVCEQRQHGGVCHRDGGRLRHATRSLRFSPARR